MYGSFHTTMAEVRSCNRDSTDHKAKDTYYLLLYRESVPA